MKDDSILYNVVRPVVTFFIRVFIRPKIINNNYIPTKGKVILAGTHTNNLDSLLLMAVTKRKIHFLAKSQLFTGIKGLLFKHMGLISVDRSRHDHGVIDKTLAYLKKDAVIGIFPEGTTEKGRGLLLFKIGTVKISQESNSKIIPFVIKGKYRLFSKDLKIIFGRPFNIKSTDLDKENELFRKRIEKMLGSDD